MGWFFNSKIKHRKKSKYIPKEFCKLDGLTRCKEEDKQLRPLIARAGGKSQLADKIINKMKPHKVYNEPFVGGGCGVP